MKVISTDEIERSTFPTREECDILSLSDRTPVNVYDAISAFYVAEALSLEAEVIPERQEELAQIRQYITSNLADALHDYLLLACCGEARYSFEMGNVHIAHLFPDGEKPSLRSYSAALSMEYSEREMEEVLPEIFWENQMPDKCGGEVWAKAAEALYLYHQNKKIFVDSAVSLRHNTNTIFDKKEYRVLSYRYDGARLTSFLDYRRDEKDLCLFVHLSAMNKSVKMPKALADITALYLERKGKTVPTIPTCDDIEGFPYQPIRWGGKEITVINGKFRACMCAICHEKRVCMKKVVLEDEINICYRCADKEINLYHCGCRECITTMRERGCSCFMCRNEEKFGVHCTCKDCIEEVALMGCPCEECRAYRFEHFIPEAALRHTAFIGHESPYIYRRYTTDNPIVREVAAYSHWAKNEGISIGKQLGSIWFVPNKLVPTLTMDEPKFNPKRSAKRVPISNRVRARLP